MLLSNRTETTSATDPKQCIGANDAFANSDLIAFDTVVADDVKVAPIASEYISTISRRVLRDIRAELGDKVFESWFTGLRVERITDGVASLTLPTAFLRSWIAKNYGDPVARAFRSADPSIVRLEYHLRSQYQPRHSVENGEQAGLLDQAAAQSAAGGSDSATAARSSSQGSQALANDMVFDTFLCNGTNDFAVAAAKRVVASFPDAEFNPLTICGSVGVGKTHLLNAVGLALQSKVSRYLLISSVSFVQEFAKALSTRSTHEFRSRFEELELLLIDDIGFLAEKEAFAQEFFDLLNRFLDSGRQVVITSRFPPSQIQAFDERLRSRLGGGLVARIDDADTELRRRFIQKRCSVVSGRSGSVMLEDEVISYLASNVTGNLRELTGAINRLCVTAQCHSESLTVPVVADVLRDLVQSKPQMKVSIESIQKIVAERFQVTAADLISNRRTRSIARPRQIAMYLAKQLTTRSYPEIGRMFGGKDHTTIIHAYRRVEKLRASEPGVDDDIRVLMEQIKTSC